MPPYISFSFEELLTETGKRNLPEILSIKNDSPEILIIIRILSGSVKLTHNYTNQDIVCRTNYFANDFKHYGQRWKKEFPLLISNSMTATDLGEYINATKYTNKKFYKNILSEICQFTYASKKGSHTAAFIFIYRLLEKISFAFPLIYASKTQDFVNTFKQLKTLMSGDTDKGELGFFKTFIQELYKDDPIAETSVDMNIVTSDQIVQDQIFNQMKKVIQESIIHADTVEPSKLSIKYCDMGSFIITIRNRFFHNMNGGKKNIDSEMVIDSDLFFHSINASAMQWLSTVFLGILSYNISEYQKIKNMTS